jgi:hypothetical protein
MKGCVGRYAVHTYVHMFLLDGKNSKEIFTNAELGNTFHNYYFPSQFPGK